MSNDEDATMPHGDAGSEVNGMSRDTLGTLFSFAEDPEFLQACEQGHSAFSQAVLDTSTKRSTDTWRQRRVDQPDMDEMSRQRRHRPASSSGVGGPGLGVGGHVKKGARVSGTQRVKLVNDLRKQYERGASIRALAEQTGRSYGFVHRVLSESGTVFRSGRSESSRIRKET